jgi:alpha-mannosidase
MRNHIKRVAAFAIGVAACLTAQPQTPVPPDTGKQPTLYVIPYAHLDTQWRWDFQQVISENLLKTMRVNFDLFEKYPHYVFNWTGSNRYRLMKEYYPQDYRRLKQYVAQGKWIPAGSSVEEADANLPSAESLFRQILYGNTYFRNEFGRAPADVMLPDTFGFPGSLPTIMAHAGIKGFSTQKLLPLYSPAPLAGGADSLEQTPDGVPFNVGLWEGPDGSTVISALNPGPYESRIQTDLSKPLPSTYPALIPNASSIQRILWDFLREQDWVKRIDLDGKVSGVYADYHYVGTGDIGGAPDEDSVRVLEATVSQSETSLTNMNKFFHDLGLAAESPADKAPNISVRVGDGPVHVLASRSDQMFLDIKPEMTTSLPRYKGDLELTNHTPGSLTSQAYHKRWNRQNEILAGAAEEASIAATWMGGRSYPATRLNDAWNLVLGGQFHDTGGGTASPRAYEFAQNDEVIALNQFADVLTDATQSVAYKLDTRSRGVPVVVFNSLNIEREDVVEATLPTQVSYPKGVRVFAPNGGEVAAQIEGNKVLFVAKAPPVSFSSYDIRSADKPSVSRELTISNRSLENARYRILLAASGDVTSIFDKSLNKELLSGPVRLAISKDAPRGFPAWNMDFDQEQAEPIAYVGGNAKIRIVENGPVRVTLEVSREANGSKFMELISLSAGDGGKRIEFRVKVDWKTQSANLKAVFPLSARNEMATYNWEVGTIERPTASSRQFEVGSHHWVDVTDEHGQFGSTILTDVKNGSDKRDDHTIRLTLIRTPGITVSGGSYPTAGLGLEYTDQLIQDWGHHEILFGLAGHAQDWRSSQSDWQAYRLSTPLISFTTQGHSGALGRSFSLVNISNPRIRVLAIKKAELDDNVIIRMVELDGKNVANVRVTFAGRITQAREVNGQEQDIGPATLVGGALETSFVGYEPKTFAVKLDAAPIVASQVQSMPISLPYNVATASEDDAESTGGFDDSGNALPAEMLPSKITFNDIVFHLAASGAQKLNAVTPRGQVLNLPSGNFNKVYVLAAAYGGDGQVEFEIDRRRVGLTIHDWGGFIGQWDTRLWKPAPAVISVGGPSLLGNLPVRLVRLRTDWAVSANHAKWNIADQGSPTWTPQYPGDYLGLRPGYIKQAPLAWYASHHHTREGLNLPYEYSYLFAYAIALPPDAKSITLPVNDKVRILAISVARTEPDVSAAQPLFDCLDLKNGQEGGPAQDEIQRSTGMTKKAVPID